LYTLVGSVVENNFGGSACAGRPGPRFGFIAAMLAHFTYALF